MCHIKGMFSMQHRSFLSFAWNTLLAPSALRSAGHGGCSLSSPVYLYGLFSCHYCSPDFKILASRVSSSCSLLHRFFKLIEGHQLLEWFISTAVNNEVVEKDLNEFQLSISPATLNCFHGFSAMTSSHCGPFSSPLHTTSSYLLKSS